MRQSRHHGEDALPLYFKWTRHICVQPNLTGIAKGTPAKSLWGCSQQIKSYGKLKQPWAAVMVCKSLVKWQSHPISCTIPAYVTLACNWEERSLWLIDNRNLWLQTVQTLCQKITCFCVWEEKCTIQWMQMLQGGYEVVMPITAILQIHHILL